jgi:uncharacterized protein YndB with AHSA1/START domain
VFQAWTRAEELKQWFAPGPDFSIPIVEIDLRVGGHYRIGMQAPGRAVSVATGIYEEITPPARLVFTWRWAEAPADTPTTRVTVEFRPKDGGTELILVHDNFSDANDRDQHEAGWVGCLNQLDRTLSISQR